MKAKLLILLFAMAWICGCERGGTGTGNPGLSSGEPSGDSGTASARIAAEACSKIASCHPETTQTACLTESLTSTTFAPKLGVTTQPAPTLQVLMGMEDDGLLVARAQPYSDCLSAIKILSCGEQVVRDGFQSENPLPHAGASLLLGAACTGVFAVDGE